MFNKFFGKLFLLLGLAIAMPATAEVAYSYEDLRKLGIPLNLLHSRNTYLEFIDFISPLPPEEEEPPPEEEPSEDDHEHETLTLEELLLKAYFAYHKRDYEGCRGFLARAEKLAPEHPKVNAMQGSLYYKLKFPKLAKEKWEKSLTADPEQRQVQYFLKKLNKEIISSTDSQATTE